MYPSCCTQTHRQTFSHSSLSQVHQGEMLNACRLLLNGRRGIAQEVVDRVDGGNQDADADEGDGDGVNDYEDGGDTREQK